jgi:TonB-linked SusC/RagA family outer membrane protein
MKHPWCAMVLTPLLGILLWTAPAAAQVQGGRVMGRVLDASTLQPLAGATVVVQGTNVGAISRSDGGFLLANVPAGAQTVRASLIGYTAQDQQVTVVAGESVPVTFQLLAQAVILDEVVAVGYGTVRRSDLTGSVASVRSEELLQTAVVNLQTGLQGRVAGVQVTQGDAAPGGGIRMQIRGVNSMNQGSAEPLYVIDGVPIASTNASKRRIGAVSEENLSSLTETSPLAQLSPADIASIEILKDASATAIYGSRGANGVVIITTRRGRSARGTMTVDASQGMAQVVRTIPMLNAYEYANYVNQSYINIDEYDNRVYGGALRLGSLTPDSIASLVGNGVNWQDEIFRTAPVTDAQVSFGGADDMGSYLVGGNWLQQTGVVHGSQFRRGGVRLNMERQVIHPNVRVSSNVAVTRSANEMVRSATINGYRSMGIVRQALNYRPWILPDSTGFIDMRSEDPAAPAILGSNPLRYTTDVSELDEVTRAIGGVRLSSALPHGLALEFAMGGNFEGRKYGNYFSRHVNEGAGVNGNALQARTEFGNLVSEALVRMQRQLGPAHRVDAVTGVTYETSRSSWLTSEVQTFPDDILRNVVLQNGTNVRTPQSGMNDWQLASWLGRVNYVLLDRYLLTGTIRADGSSRFAENNKWAVFPAFAVAWNMANEPFLADQNLLSELKLRLSYGRSGNQAISPYQSQAAIAGTGTTVVFGGQQVAAYALTQLPNPNLRWETTDQFDVGLDIGALNNRFTATVDLYQKNTRDLLQQIQLPRNTGFSQAWINSGEVTNKGVEFSAGYLVIPGPRPGAPTWSISGNASRNRNRIESLGPIPSQFAGRLGAGGSLEVAPFIQKPGLPIGAMWGYVTDGLIRTAADSIAYAAMGSPAFIGDYRLKDISGPDGVPDGRITQHDQMVVGDANPDWVFGLTNRFTWGRFDLSALVTAVQGGDIINTQRMNYLQLNGQGMNVPQEFVRDAFHPVDNPDGKYPIIRNNRGGWGGRFMDVFVEDGSYVRLKNVNIGYQLPLRGAQTARVYVNGINLFTSTDYTGFDPEVSAFGGTDRPGVDQGSYPQSRQVSVGISATF